MINVNEPDSLITFAQESGRAGRDGTKAYSVIFLPTNWQARPLEEEMEGSYGCEMYDARLRKERDRQAMHRYLNGKQCYRTSLSEYLDLPQHRRWCMAEDIPCDICLVSHEETIPERHMTQESTLAEPTGLAMIQKQQLRAQLELTEYRANLVAVRGICPACRVAGDDWEHVFSTCVRRHAVFKARRDARRRFEQRQRTWLQAYTACFWCLNPQVVCERASGSNEGGMQQCEDGDVVLPVCYTVYSRVGGPQWIYEQFGHRFEGMEGFLDSIGEETLFGGYRAIQGIRVTAAVLNTCRQDVVDVEGTDGQEDAWEF